MPSKYGFGNTRKKSPYKMGKAHYGKDQKNPMPMLGDLDKDGEMSEYESKRQAAIEKNSPNKMYGEESPAKNYKNPQDYKVFNMGNKPTPVKMYGHKSPAKKYKSDAQRKAVHASKAEKK